MTDKSYIQEIKQTKKWRRKFEDNLNYFILIAPIAVSFIGLAMMLGNFQHRLGYKQFFFGFLCILIGLLFTYFTLKRLNENVTFEIIEDQNTLELKTLKQEIEKNFRTENIFINEKLGVIEVITQLSGFSWGEKITLIKDENTYLVNSRPSDTSQPITIYKDRKNIHKIRKILTEQIAQE